MGDVAGAKQLRRLLEAVTSLGSELSLPVVLRNITEAAIDLVDARYGAVGVLDRSRTGLVEFITVGIDDEGIAAIGRLPEGHGILGKLIVDQRPLRLPDLTQHPDSYGFPPHHPNMSSFLGVPIWVGDEVFGNLYLTEKGDGEVFTDVDEELVLGLAAAAGVAIENARLHEQVQAVAVLQDRERIARDLHDTVIQRLFATGLLLQGAHRLTARPEVADRIQQAVDDLDITVRHIRSVIFELQPVSASGDSVRRELLAVAIEEARALGFDPVVRFDGPVDTAVDPELSGHLLNTVREALSNIVRHADAQRAEVDVTVSEGSLCLTVTDDGRGIDLAAAAVAGGHGLVNMRNRAESLGGSFRSDLGSGGKGTIITWQVPLR
ncbi:MAG TPA: GAF domain-containing protein [Acidimicrobiales bacterium]|nr:GAF domain-containing protein [Acidimicrobiales bacterium]